VLENKHALQIWASGHAEATVNFGGVGDLDLHPVRTKKPCYKALEQRPQLDESTANMKWLWACAFVIVEERTKLIVYLDSNATSSIGRSEKKGKALFNCGSR
jgi:hypothetical protein